ncbi:hypothetical protein JCM3766R1_005342, partial [Sporobolomyces carnicolor]
TGLKALPHAKLPLHGDVLHDAHAEIIARRGLKRWLYRQLELASEGNEATFLCARSPREWRLKEGWSLGLWISTLPCGDASMYTLAQSSLATGDLLDRGHARPPDGQPTSLSEAATLGLVTTRSPSLADGDSPLVHRGRVSYSTLSALRTKPGRADSPPTTSHSCSDKIALWSLLGVEGALLSNLGLHVELALVAVSGIDASADETEKIKCEIRRAVGGRLEGWQGPRGARVRVPEVSVSTVEFKHSRARIAATAQCREEDVVSCQE